MKIKVGIPALPGPSSHDILLKTLRKLPVPASVLFLVSCIVFFISLSSCRTVQEEIVPVVYEEPQPDPEIEYEARAQEMLKEAVKTLEQQDILSTLIQLTNMLAQSGQEDYAFTAAQRVFRDAEGLRNQIIENIRLRPGDTWSRAGDRGFTPARDMDGEDLNTFVPAFHLLYTGGSEPVPIKGIGYRFEYPDGVPLSDTELRTDDLGRGTSGPLEAKLEVMDISLAILPDPKVADLFDTLQFTFRIPAARVRIRVKQGERVSDLAARLTDRSLTTMDAVYYIAANERYDEYLSVPVPYGYLSRFEGQFKPGVYIFFQRELPRIDTAEASVAGDRAVSNAKKIFTRLLDEAKHRSEDYYNRIQISLYQQYILASMVEKESVSNTDYGEVAAVFINRLIGGSHLSSCPTVEYALGYHRPFLTLDDIAIESPYNVYAGPGLPPTPICFFSDEALAAVRDPNRSNSYFFVFDWTTGKLTFATYFEDHQVNVQIAKANYMEKFGTEELHKIYYDKYYEPVHEPEAPE